jgi:DNA-binding CsgD family transcriptional regulator
MAVGLRRSEHLHMKQLAVIDAIYAAVADSTRWDQVIAAINDMVGDSVTSLLRTTPHSGDVFIATTLDPAFARAYAEYYAPLNPWTAHAAGAHGVLQVNDDGLAALDVERTEFYADWMRPQGIRYPICTNITLSTGETLNFASIRVPGLGAFEPAECDAVLALRPHLYRAAELSRRLALAEAGKVAAAQSHQRLGAGLLLVDTLRHVHLVDAGAEQIVGSGNGLWIQGGRLRASVGFDAQLEEAIARATGRGRSLVGRSGLLLTLPRSGGHLPLSIAVSPVDERDRPWGVAGPLAMAFVTDPEKAQRPTEEGLRALFDFTPAEAKLVVGLCAGATLASYAQATGTSLNTVKSHLKRVFDKTGESRQADLVRRVSEDVALRLGPGVVQPAVNSYCPPPAGRDGPHEKSR